MLGNPIYYGAFRYKDSSTRANTRPSFRSRSSMTARPSWKTGAWVQVGPAVKTCGCAITAELKKGKYVYYHCTTNRGGCTRKSVTEADLAEQLGGVLAKLQLDERMAETLRTALRASLADETAYHERMVGTLKLQDEKLAARLSQLYIDKLDGCVSDEMYDQLKAQFDGELAAVREKLAAHQVADRKYLEFGIQLFELSQTAYSSYLQRSPAEKREMLDFLCSNCLLVDGKVIATYRKPFDVIASAPTMMEKRSEPDPSDPTRCLVEWA